MNTDALLSILKRTDPFALLDREVLSHFQAVGHNDRFMDGNF